MQLQLEGPDLEVLLEQVRTEYGAAARIVQAEKVRRGGVGGLFAREWFQLQVEVSEQIPRVGGVTRAAGAAARNGSGGSGRGGTGAGGGPGAGAGARAAAPRTRAEARAQARAQAQAQAQARAASGAEDPVRSVMDLVDRLNEEEAALHHGLGGVASGVAGGVASGVTGGVRGDAAVATAGGANGSAGAASGDPSAVAGVVIGAVAPPSAEADPGAQPLSTQGSSFADVLTRLQHSVEDRHGPGSTPDHAAGTGGAAAYRLDERPARLGSDLAQRAVRLGVPEQVLAGAADAADTYRRLLAWVESRPPAPLLIPAPGQVIVLAGEVASALRAAGVVSREIGLDPSAVHLAVSGTAAGHEVPVARLLSDPADIALRRQRWRHAPGGTIVVVEAPLPLSSPGWVSAVVAALAPTFTWAVAQASTKVPDVTAWAARIGQVDALALEHVDATADPAAALAGPLPVGLLDGRRASVARWMALITQEAGRR